MQTGSDVSYASISGSYEPWPPTRLPSGSIVGSLGMTRIFRKTDKGVDEIATRANRLVPRLRTALILVDGTRNEAELSGLIKPQPAETLEELLTLGYIEVAAVAEPAVKKPADAAGDQARSRTRQRGEGIRELPGRGRARVQRPDRPRRRGAGDEDGEGGARASNWGRCCRPPIRSSATRAASRPPPSSRRASPPSESARGRGLHRQAPRPGQRAPRR